MHGEPALLDRLDQALWTFEPLEFVPHIVLPRDGADATRVANTPIVLLKGESAAPAACRVAVTLAAHPVGDVAAFDRLIAIIGLSPEHREAGRQRWREYERAGHSVSHAKPANEAGTPDGASWQGAAGSGSRPFADAAGKPGPEMKTPGARPGVSHPEPHRSGIQR